MVALEQTQFDTRDQNLIVILLALRHEIKAYSKRNGIVTVGDAISYVSQKAEA